MSKMLVMIALIAVTAAVGCTAAYAAGKPAPLQTGFVLVRSGPGHAPDEPAASIRGARRSYQSFLGSRALASSAKACQQHSWYQEYDFKNVYGVMLFSYAEQAYWCRSGGMVTYFYRYRWHHESSLVPVVHYSPWQFDGNVPSGNDCANEHCYIRGYKAPRRTAVTEGKFETCLVPFINLGCNYDYPVIHITVYGDGSRPDSGWSD